MPTPSLPCAWLVLGVALLVPAKSASPADRPELETVRLMQVEGRVLIDADGSVSSAEVSTERVTPQLRDALLAKARAWRFKPFLVRGQSIQTQTKFRLVLAARQAGETFDVRIDDVNFDDPDNTAAVLPDGMLAQITGKRLNPPMYPRQLQASNRTGEVLLAILVGADGRAEKVQVVRSMAHDFEGRLGDNSARATMHVLEANAVIAARQWTFNIPPARAAASPAERTVTVPVTYILRYDVNQAGYWIPVHRGEFHPAEWLPSRGSSGFAFGGAGASTVSALDSPYKLLQPAAGTALN